MLDIASLEPLLRSLIVALPVLVLIVLFFLLAAARRNSRQNAADGASEADSPVGPTPLPVMSGATEVLTEASERPAIQLHDQADALQVEVEAAEEADETIKLAHLYLQLGRARIAAGEEQAGLEALRSSAGLAALYKAPRIHAEARLELAEAAIRHGDPTTACEHWQMARMAFLDEGDKKEGDKIDRRMRAQGCPTDWVLTDF